MSAKLEPKVDALRAYVREHGVVPSLADLAALWGYASKASSARVVDQLVRLHMLARSPNGRLRPGTEFTANTLDTADRQDAIAAEWKERWGPHQLAEAYDIATRITRLAQLIENNARQTAGINGLTIGELLVLDVLYRLGPPYTCAPTMLGHHFALTLPGVGKRLASLERHQLIDRVRCDNDGRSLLVVLNARGRDRLAQAAQSDLHAPHIRWAMALGEAERAALLNTLRRAFAAIQPDHCEMP